MDYYNNETILNQTREIESLRQQLAAAEAAMQEVGGAVESNKAVYLALEDVDYRGSYADGVKYLKRQLTAVAKDRDEIAAQARMLDRMVDERDDQLASALAEQNEKMRKVLLRLACLGNGDQYGNSIGNCIAQEALSLPDLASPVLNRIRAEGGL